MRQLRFAPLLSPLLVLAMLPACTEITENYPEGGCVAGSFQCVGLDVARCLEDGSRFELFKVCPADNPCSGNPPDCPAFSTGDPSCQTDDDCAAQLGAVGVCHVAICDGATCRVAEAETATACDDGNACTHDDACTTGTCQGVAVLCDDQNPCTTDACDPAAGCIVSDADGLACDDGNPCTKQDVCEAAACVGTALQCEDGNPCTSDECDQAKGDCVHVAKAGPCDDDDLCTVQDVCVAGACQGKPNPDCSCAVDADCAQFTSNNPCKGKYACADELCTLDATTAYQCPQSGLGPCHIAQCVAQEGLPTCAAVAQPDGSACNDGDPCTTEELCQAGECVGSIDASVAGCGFFRVGWYRFTGETMLWYSEQAGASWRITGTMATPSIVGESTDTQYRVRALTPGLQ